MTLLTRYWNPRWEEAAHTALLVMANVSLFAAAHFLASCHVPCDLARFILLGV